MGSAEVKFRDGDFNIIVPGPYCNLIQKQRTTHHHQMDFEPPFQTSFKTLSDDHDNYSKPEEQKKVLDHHHPQYYSEMEELAAGSDHEQQLPVIDLSQLASSREECVREIVEASKEWGFFQVVNHGISQELLEKMVDEEVKLFRQPFDKKSKLLPSSDSYRWGTPTAKRMGPFSWSEAFHIPLTDVVTNNDTLSQRDLNTNNHNSTTNLRSTIEKYAMEISDLAQRITDILGENLLGYKSDFFEENCLLETAYLRLNRYPPCPKISSLDVNLFGLMPHTDTSFLTILYQHKVGGLQLVKNGRWITVKPNPQALIINIGDLFQAWSNGVYKSVEHRVLVNKQVERFSIAYFVCPPHDTMIQSYAKPRIYRDFTFREFKQQIQEDVKTVGSKIGLPRFLL